MRRTTEAGAVMGQLAAVWVLGALVLPLSMGRLAVVVFAAGPAGAAAAVLLISAVLVVCLWSIVSATARASWLGATGIGRVVWAVLVCGFGSALWWLGWAVTDEAELGVSASSGLTLVCSGIPFLLVAGMLLRRWYLGLSAVLALAAFTAYGAVALRDSGPDEISLRLRHAQLDRATALVVEIPGYRPADTAYGERVGTGVFVPEDPAAIPPERYVSIVAYTTLVPLAGVCGQTALDSLLYPAGECTAEPNGLVYRRGAAHHGYQVRRGRVTVEVAGTLAVERRLVRDAAATVRLAKPSERPPAAVGDQVFVADLPGYTGRPTGIPAGMVYQPADHTGTSRSIAIEVRADRISVDGLCFDAECVTEDVLTYVRRADEHGYLQRRADVNVLVTGGVSVDRALLRQTILAIRPATDTELNRALPQPPPRTRLDRLRHWLREHT